MRVHMVRHGVTEWNAAGRIQGSLDIGLSARGFEQAEELARSLRERGIELTKVYSSKLKRAYSTGQIVADCLGLSIESLEGVQEICLGDWEGLTWKQVAERYREQYRAWAADRRYSAPPNGETHQQVLQRLVPALLKVVDANDADVLVVAHGFGISCMNCLLFDRSFNDINEHRVKNGQVVSFDEDQIRHAGALLGLSSPSRAERPG